MGRKPIGETAMTGAERQRRYLESRLQRAATKGDTARIRGLEERIRELEAALREREKARPAPGAADAAAEAKKPSTEHDIEDQRTIDRLKRSNTKLRAELRDMKKWYDDKIASKGGMTFEQYSKIVKYLHRTPSAAETDEAITERDEAIKAFNAYRSNARQAK